MQLVLAQRQVTHIEASPFVSWTLFKNKTRKILLSRVCIQKTTEYERRHPHRELSTTPRQHWPPSFFPECILPFVLPTTGDDIFRSVKAKTNPAHPSIKHGATHHASSLLCVVVSCPMARPFHVGLQTRWRLLSDAYVTRTRGESISLCRHGLRSSALKGSRRVGLDVSEATPAQRGVASYRIAASGSATLKPFCLAWINRLWLLKGDGFTASCQFAEVV